jgi:hypothetical protein
MKKLRRSDVEALRREMPVLDEDMQRSIYGGCGSYGGISQSEYYNWSGSWPGGYVEGLGYVAADSNVTGYNLSNPGPSSSYYDSYGSYSGDGTNHYNNNLDEMNKVASLSGATGFVAQNTFLLGEADRAGNFNIQLGQIMGHHNYGSGQPFYIQEIGFGLYNIYSYNGQYLGQIDVQHKGCSNYGD